MGFIILGLVAIYTWVHATVLMYKKIWNEVTQYEKVVCIASTVFFVLYLLGTTN